MTRFFSGSVFERSTGRVEKPCPYHQNNIINNEKLQNVIFDVFLFYFFYIFVNMVSKEWKENVHYKT